MPDETDLHWSTLGGTTGVGVRKTTLAGIPDRFTEPDPSKDYSGTSMVITNQKHWRCKVCGGVADPCWEYSYRIEEDIESPESPLYCYCEAETRVLVEEGE